MYITQGQVQQYLGLTIEESDFSFFANKASKLIDLFTGNIFSPKELTFYLDGRFSTLLELPYSCISLSKFAVRSSDTYTDISQTEYYLYNGNNPSVDYIPRIKYKNNKDFTIGNKNYLVMGVFGCCEYNSESEEWEVPLLIQDAALRIFYSEYKKSEQMKNSGAQTQLPDNIRPFVVSETTDGHSYKISEHYFKESGVSQTLTGDLITDSILNMYMRNPRVAII